MAPSPALSSTTPSEPRVCLEGTSLLRTPSQCKQVRPHSFPRFYFHGNEFSDPPQPGQGLAPTSVRPHCKGLTQSHITAQDFLSLNGILSSVADFVLLGRLFLHPLQHYLSSLWVRSPGNLLARIPILPPLVPHLQWWLVEETLLAGVPLLPSQPSLHLITDASKEGWGAHLEPLSLTVSGMWSPQESLLHINNLEMRAARLAVTNFQAHLQDSCVMLSTDNTSVVSYVQAQGGTHSHSLVTWRPGICWSFVGI